VTMFFLFFSIFECSRCSKSSDEKVVEEEKLSLLFLEKFPNSLILAKMTESKIMLE